MYTKQLTILLSSVVWLLVPASFSGDVFAAEPEVRPLVRNLENPSGVAVHAKSGHIFVSTRYGVYRFKPEVKSGGSKQIVPLVIANSAKETDVYGKGPKYDIGPLGLAFMDDDHLVVGDGSRKDGDEFVRVYKIGDGKDEGTEEYEPLDDKSAVHTLGPIKAGEQSAKGEGNFYGVAVGAGAIFVTCNGDDTKGWVAKSELKDGKPGALTPTIATKVATSVDAPVAITFTPDGKQLVVGQMGEMTVPGDSLLTFYDAGSGELKRNLKTGLSDLAGLAYSPKTGKLYGTDFSWSDTSKGGLFELVIEGDVVKPKKILSLDKPTAITFDKAGNLYIAIFGSVKEGDKKEDSPGTLKMIAAGL